MGKTVTCALMEDQIMIKRRLEILPRSGTIQGRVGMIAAFVVGRHFDRKKPPIILIMDGQEILFKFFLFLVNMSFI